MFGSTEPLRARLAVGVLLTLALVAVVASVAPASPAAQATEPLDLRAVYAIKQEGLQNSQVMEIMSWLTDVYGARLTGSPNIWEAGAWARSQLEEWGLVNAALEPWGPFGVGWSNQRFTAHVVEPRPFPLIGYPKAWTSGTGGPVRGEAILAIIENEDQFEEYAGRLGGKFVLTASMPAVEALWEPPAHRFTDEELLARAQQQLPSFGFGRGGRGGRGNFQQQRQFRERLDQFYRREGVAALLDPGRGSGGTVFVGGGGSREAGAEPALPQVSLAVEHYGRIYRMLEKEVPVVLEMDVENTFHDATLDSFNVVAEIPGTDLADEIVMLGAHFDSWHSGTGATDNAAGSAVMMEAVRILQATGLPLRRTVRIGLWTGEEQGLLGSRAYVTEHFGDRETMELKPAHANFSAYYNVDNGTGAIRGVYLQGNEVVAPIFEAWMEPFHNLGMTTLSIRNTGGTDHLAFDAVGLPGFQFIQDPVEYGSRTHHSSMDVYERIQPADMMKNAVIVASFVYHTATRDELLPRKPLPEPSGGRGGRGGPVF